MELELDGVRTLHIYWNFWYKNITNVVQRLPRTSTKNSCTVRTPTGFQPPGREEITMLCRRKGSPKSGLALILTLYILLPYTGFIKFTILVHCPKLCKISNNKKNIYGANFRLGNFFSVAPPTPTNATTTLELWLCPSTARPLLMNLYPTPPSILHHGHHPPRLGDSARPP